MESALSALRKRMRWDAGEAAVAIRVVYAAVLAYAALFVFAAVVHYLAFQTGRADLGNMVQAVWNTLHGHFLEGTTINGRQGDRLGYHVDPLLLLFAPLFRVWSSPLILPTVQALAVATGALPVFWLARKHLESPRAGAHFALAYLLYPATQFSAFTPSSFHPVAIAVPLVLYAIWFLDEDRLVAFSAIALLAFTTKEEIPLAVGCLGLWYAVRSGRRLFGLSVFAAGLAVTSFNFLWLIPHFSPTGANPFAGRYIAIGGTPHGILHTLFTNPYAFVHAVATWQKAAYVLLMIVPLLGLWLVEPLLFLGAIPDIAINVLSSDGPALSAERTAPVVPFLIAASILGAARFKRHSHRLSLLALLGVALVAAYSPLIYLRSDVTALGSSSISARKHAVSLVPRGTPVSASNLLAAHLSERRYIYVFPFAVRAQWIVVDINDPSYRDTTEFRRRVRKFEASPAWRTVFFSHGIAVLHAVADEPTTTPSASH